MAKRKTKTVAADSLDYILQALRSHAVPIDSLTPDPCNPNSHNEGSIAGIAASLREFGQRKPLIVNERTKVILSGNGTHAAAKSLGWTHIAAFEVPDDPVANARWSIVDNRSAEFSEWDVENLNALRTGLDESDAWADLDEMFLLNEICPPPADEDLPPAPNEPILERHQLVITVPDQQTQEELFRELSGRNFKVRVLTT